MTGHRNHLLYGTWSNMMTRCYNPKTKQFKDYGGRGITVCSRWHDPRLFIEDIENTIGPRPAGMTLDRIDNDSEYAPGKVRWATRAEQIRNSRRYIDGTHSGPLYAFWWRTMQKHPERLCESWHDFAQFRDGVASQIGPRPENGAFRRIDPDGLFEPRNVAWR